MAKKGLDYRRMTVVQKHEYSRLFEPPMRCVVCEMAVQPDDLLAHVDGRCPGRPEPHRRSRWLTLKDASRIGPTQRTVLRLAARKEIRTKGEKGHTRYLMRDIARYQAGRVTAEAKRAAKRLTMQAQKGDGKGMTKEMELEERVKAYASEIGGIDAVARSLDIPRGTISKAMKSCKGMRQGTLMLLEARLTGVGA